MSCQLTFRPENDTLHVKGGRIMATLTQTENQIRPLYIDGYTHQLSYAPGEEIAFHISTSAEIY